MTIWERMKLTFSRKESLARTVTTMRDIGKAVSTPVNYENFAKQGYQKSVVVYSAIGKITKACSGIPFALYSGPRNNSKELLEHPLLKLLARPNPLQAQSAFIESVVGFYLLDGNSYIESNKGATVDRADTKAPALELWPARPDKMKIVGGPKGYPRAYQFSSGGITQEWPVDLVNMKSQILHWKTFHPTNDWYGMSPLEAAMTALDQNNAGQRWNLSLLQNSATPSGVLQMKLTDANPRGELTAEQYARLKNEFESSYIGARNAGKPLVVEGGLTWSAMSLSPKEMDFLKGKEVSATDLCIAFGVPPEIMGLGEKTFNNYREARCAFYEETILPTMDALLNELNHWLVPTFGEQLFLDYDKDEIEALAYKRETKFTSVGGANFLTINEKREAVGYEPKENWDVFLIGNQLVIDPTEVMDPSGDTDPNIDEDETQENDESSKPKPKPPVGQGDEEGDEEDETEEGEDYAKGWKSINRLTKREKKQTWNAQNRARKFYANGFNSDLQIDFKELSKILEAKGEQIEQSKLKDPKMIEFILLKSLHDFMPTMTKTVSAHIEKVTRAFGVMLIDEGKALGYDSETKANRRFDNFVKDYTASRTGENIKSVTSTTQKRIKRIVGEWVQEGIESGDTLPDLSKFIHAEFSELNASQAMRIARTEVSMASNAGTREAVKSLQIPNMVKEWVSADDDRVRAGEYEGADHEVMNGETAPLDEKFTVPPDASMDGPGDAGGGADQVINCRCVLTFASKN